MGALTYKAASIHVHADTLIIISIITITITTEINRIQCTCFLLLL